MKKDNLEAVRAWKKTLTEERAGSIEKWIMEKESAETRLKEACEAMAKATEAENLSLFEAERGKKEKAEAALEMATARLQQLEVAALADREDALRKKAALDESMRQEIHETAKVLAKNIYEAAKAADALQKRVAEAERLYNEIVTEVEKEKLIIGKRYHESIAIQQTIGPARGKFALNPILQAAARDVGAEALLSLEFMPG